jgi:hypothetical protein
VHHARLALQIIGAHPTRGGSDRVGRTAQNLAAIRVGDRGISAAMSPPCSPGSRAGATGDESTPGLPRWSRASDPVIGRELCSLARQSHRSRPTDSASERDR